MRIESRMETNSTMDQIGGPTVNESGNGALPTNSRGSKVTGSHMIRKFIALHGSSCTRNGTPQRKGNNVYIHYSKTSSEWTMSD